MNPLIIIPTYNEVENIELIVEKIFSELDSTVFSILIVDDNSTDGTKQKIYELKSKYNNLSLLERSEKKGLASAYIDGINFGINNNFDIFIEMDADLSHDPKYLPEMLSLANDYDVVIGSRNIEGGCVVNWGFIRNLISKGGSLYSRLILGCNIKDLTGGYNLWNKSIIEKINLDNIFSKGYCFQIEMKYKAYKNKAKIKEIPITFVDRKYGQSKMSKSIFAEALKGVIKLRFSK